MPRENQEFHIDTKTHFSSPIYSYAEHNLLLNDFNFWEEETKQFWGTKEQQLFFQVVTYFVEESTRKRRGRQCIFLYLYE